MAIISLLLLAAAVSCEFVLPLPENQYATTFDSNDNGRIVGGKVAKVGQFPYIAAIVINDRIFCGGTIIFPTWILTAAHCVDIPVDPSDITISVGYIFVELGDTYKAKRMIAHEEYDPSTQENDIGLLEIENFFKFNNRVRPANIGSSRVGINVEAVVSGWGLTSYPGNVSIPLKYIHVRTDNPLHCRRIWQETAPIFGSQICTLSPRGEGACRGDSGGPLAINNTVIGIVSYGHPCALGVPDVYTRVSSYFSWIINHLIRN